MDINFYGNPMPEYYRVQKVSSSSASWQTRGAAGICLSHRYATMTIKLFFVLNHHHHHHHHHSLTYRLFLGRGFAAL